MSDEVSKLKLKATDVGWFELDVTNIVHTWRKDPFSNQGLSIKVLDDHGEKIFQDRLEECRVRNT